MIVNAGGEIVKFANVWLAVCDALSATLITNVYDPAVVGVPLSAPVLALSDKPGGRVPLPENV